MKESTDIFVFGSNTAGYHGAAAARYAMENHGAVWGRGVGLYGNSYALPTKDRKIETLSIKEIEQHVEDFFEVVRRNPDLTFWVTQIGCGLAGFKAKQIAPLFALALELDNVKLPKAFLEILCDNNYPQEKISFTF